MDSSKSDSSTNPKFPFILSVLKILLTGIVVPILVSVATSFYVNTRLLRPKLEVRYSIGEVMVMSVKDRRNEYIAALVDFGEEFSASLPEGKSSLDEVSKPLEFTGGEILAAKRIRFRSDKDYTLDGPKSSRIAKIMLVNDGYTTATHINIGLKCSEGYTSYKIIPSPNISVSERSLSVRGSVLGVNVSIERLAATEKAAIALLCIPAAKAEPSDDSPFLAIHQPLTSKPILYLTSDEGSGEIAPNFTRWKDAMRWEEANFPNDASGFWALRIHPRRGVSPSMEDMKELEIGYELVDDTGHHTGKGTWKLRPEPVN